MVSIHDYIMLNSISIIFKILGFDVILRAANSLWIVIIKEFLQVLIINSLK
jgi:hypothetical protein